MLVGAEEHTGVAQVLSMMVLIPRALATAVMAGTSCTSKVCEPGDSRKMVEVLLSLSSPAIPAPTSGS